MAFGQATGPAASMKQIQELEGLLEARGFDSFKEARHPFGLTQRQASGKFTVDEATALIERLSDEDDDGSGPPTVGRPAAAPIPARRDDSGRVAERALRRQEDAAVELLSVLHPPVGGLTAMRVGRAARTQGRAKFRSGCCGGIMKPSPGRQPLSARSSSTWVMLSRSSS